MAAHTKIDLYQMQSLPLDAKIRMTARRIDAFIDRNDAYLSISGGKDSRVLDDNRGNGQRNTYSKYAGNCGYRCKPD